MSAHFFFGAVRLDHATAIRADIKKQNYTVCPRHWYVDAYLKCAGCGEVFCWSAQEQRTWFEKYGFYVDSLATRCSKCRAERRQLESLKSEYDQTIAKARNGHNLSEKKTAVALIDQISSMGNAHPRKMAVTRELLLKQIKSLIGKESFSEQGDITNND